MDDVQLFLLFVLGVIILTTVVSIITSIVNRRQFINKINGLWPNQEKIENLLGQMRNMIINFKLIVIIIMNINLSMTKLGLT